MSDDYLRDITDGPVDLTGLWVLVAVALVLGLLWLRECGIYE